MNQSSGDRLHRLDRLATMLDDSIRIPVIGYRIGYDALIGLIPGVGDVAGLALSTYIVVEAARYRIPKSTLLRMVANVAIEAVVGAVPIFGDVFDAVYKANRRNMSLLHRRLSESGADVRSDRVFFVTTLAIPFVAALLVLLLMAWLLGLLF